MTQSRLTIVSAEERMAGRQDRRPKILLTGFPGAGKTYQLHFLNAHSTLFVDSDAGDLSVADVAVDTLQVGDWPTFRDLVARIVGPNPSLPATACYSAAHFDSVGGWLNDIDRYTTFFIDSATALSRLCFTYCETQPEAFAPSGAKDPRGCYGLLSRELIAAFNHLQRARNRTVVLVCLLERKVDDFGNRNLGLQLEGKKSSRELLGLVDQIVTVDHLDFGDGKLVRSFVCSSPNSWNLLGKDRSGKLDIVEPPDLSKLIDKLLAI